MRLRTLIAVFCIVAAPATAVWAGDPMASASNTLLRNASDSGGASSASGNNAVTGAVGEAGTTGQTSSSYRLAPGAMSLFSFPGKITDLAGLTTLTTSASVQWSTPGYDGTLGPALQTGTNYYVRIASYTTPDTFNFQNSVLWFSTGPTGTAPGTVVTTAVPGLFANTTWFTTAFTLDADGNLSFMSNMSTVTTLAAAPAVLPNSYLFVNYTSATLNWAALPASPPGASSVTAEGFTLEASSTNFGALSPGGVVLTSATPNVLSSTLTVAALDLGTTWYFRVGSLNWQGTPNYANLPRLNFQIDPSSSGLSFGTINAQIVSSTVSISSVVVTNRGNLPVTLQLFAATTTAGGSPWTLGTTPDIEQVMLQGQFNTVPPTSGSFTTALLSSTQTATGTAFAGNQTAVQIPPGETRTLWFQFWLPSSTVSMTKQKFQVNLLGVYP